MGTMVKSGEAPKAPAKSATSLAVSQIGSVQQLLQVAVEKGLPAAELKELVLLHERVSDRAAAIEFAQALAAFQADCPAIGKNKEAEITTKAGGKYKYQYAPLDEIVRVVKPLLLRHGFSYGWDSKVEIGALTCICTLSHVNGHSRPASFTLPVDNPSAMSPQQKVGAALTFAQRKTLESVLGLNTTEDTDAVAREIDPTPISDDQITVITDLIAETKTDTRRFLNHFKVPKVADLPAVLYTEAIAVLKEKKGRTK